MQRSHRQPSSRTARHTSTWRAGTGYQRSGSSTAAGRRLGRCGMTSGRGKCWTAAPCWPHPHHQVQLKEQLQRQQVGGCVRLVQQGRAGLPAEPCTEGRVAVPLAHCGALYLGSYCNAKWVLAGGQVQYIRKHSGVVCCRTAANRPMHRHTVIGAHFILAMCCVSVSVALQVQPAAVGREPLHAGG